MFGFKQAIYISNDFLEEEGLNLRHYLFFFAYL